MAKQNVMGQWVMQLVIGQNHCMNCVMRCLCGKTECYEIVGNATCYRKKSLYELRDDVFMWQNIML